MKYIILDEKKEINNPLINSVTTVYRIQYIKDIVMHGIVKGDLGGWVQTIHNLSQTSDAVITGETIVTGEASIYGNALVHNSSVHGKLKEINEKGLEISGSAKILNSFIVGSPEIFDSSLVINSVIKDQAKCYGNSVVVYTEVSEIAHVFDDAIITNRKITGSKRVNNFYGYSNLTGDTQAAIDLLFADE